MKLVIKILQGDECTIDVESDATVLDVKKQIHAQCNTPVSKQRLLFLGKTLIDENQLTEYKNIKDGSKVYLVIKTPEPLDVALQKFFKQYYSAADADKHAKTVHTKLISQVNNMSWDDVERLAKFFIENDKSSDQ